MYATRIKWIIRQQVSVYLILAQVSLSHLYIRLYQLGLSALKILEVRYEGLKFTNAWIKWHWCSFFVANKPEKESDIKVIQVEWLFHLLTVLNHDVAIDGRVFVVDDSEYLHGKVRQNQGAQAQRGQTASRSFVVCFAAEVE